MPAILFEHSTHINEFSLTSPGVNISAKEKMEDKIEIDEMESKDMIKSGLDKLNNDDNLNINHDYKPRNNSIRRVQEEMRAKEEKEAKTGQDRDGKEVEGVKEEKNHYGPEAEEGRRAQEEDQMDPDNKEEIKETEEPKEEKGVEEEEEDVWSPFFD